MILFWLVWTENCICETDVHLPCRAVALGLTSDDMQAIDDFTNTLKKKRSPYDVNQLKKDAETDELKVRVSCFYIYMYTLKSSRVSVDDV